MKIIKKIVSATPLLLSFAAISPIASCAYDTNSTSISKAAEEGQEELVEIIYTQDEDSEQPVTSQEVPEYVPLLTVKDDEGMVIHENGLLGMENGTTKKIEVELYPNFAEDKSLELESSDPNVVVVENGYLIAKHTGHAVITVKANMSCPEHLISKTFDVYVVAKGWKIII